MENLKNKISLGVLVVALICWLGGCGVEEKPTNYTELNIISGLDELKTKIIARNKIDSLNSVYINKLERLVKEGNLLIIEYDKQNGLLKEYIKELKYHIYLLGL